MIPPVCSSSTRSPGEIELFEELRDAPGTDGWVVLHSLDLSEHVERVSGEVDFVVIVPGMGVVALEVKAHQRVRRIHGQWFLGGDTDGDPRGPFKQASQACHSLRQRVTKDVAAANDVPFFSAVCFPYVAFDDSSPEWHAWQVIDRVALSSRSLVPSLEGVLRHAREHLDEHNAWFDPRSDEPTDETVGAIVRSLRSDFEVHESPRSRRKRLEEEVLRYTREQMRALDQMEDNPRVVFDGPAGTGKTVLAVEAARRASLRDERTLLLCYNRNLGRRVSDETGELDGVTARTMHSYLMSLAPLDPPKGSASEFWSRQLPEAAAETLLERDEPEYDTVIVDEAQDLARTNYLDVLDLDLRGGLRGGRWMFFGDLSNQLIYDADPRGLLELMEDRGCSFSRFALRTNCRNTPRIASYAEMIGALNRGYVQTLRPDSGVEPHTRLIRVGDDPQQALVDLLEELEEDGFTGDDVVVLSPYREGLATQLTTSRWADRLAPVDEATSGRIRHGTIHEFKGLEAPAVVLTDIRSLDQEAERRLIYVGATRALHRLEVVVDATAARDLADILARSGNAT